MPPKHAIRHDSLQQHVGVGAAASVCEQSTSRNQLLGQSSGTPADRSRNRHNKKQNAREEQFPKLTQRAIRMQMRSLQNYDNKISRSSTSNTTSSRKQCGIKDNKSEYNQQLLTSFYEYIKSAAAQNAAQIAKQSVRNSSRSISVDDRRSTVTGVTFSYGLRSRAPTEYSCKVGTVPKINKKEKAIQKLKFKIFRLKCLKNTIQKRKTKRNRKQQQKLFSLISERDLKFQERLDYLIESKMRDAEFDSQAIIPVEDAADQDVDTDDENMESGKLQLLSELETAINDFQNGTDAIDQVINVTKLADQNKFMSQQAFAQQIYENNQHNSLNELMEISGEVVSQEQY